VYIIIEMCVCAVCEYCLSTEYASYNQGLKVVILIWYNFVSLAVIFLSYIFVYFYCIFMLVDIKTYSIKICILSDTAISQT